MSVQHFGVIYRTTFEIFQSGPKWLTNHMRLTWLKMYHLHYLYFQERSYFGFLRSSVVITKLLFGEKMDVKYYASLSLS